MSISGKVFPFRGWMFFGTDLGCVDDFDRVLGGVDVFLIRVMGLDYSDRQNLEKDPHRLVINERSLIDSTSYIVQL